MYIDPFTAGVAVTLFSEMMIVILYAIITAWRNR